MPVRVRKYAGLRHLIVLLTACSLFLSGCGAKLPDSGTIPSVTVAKDTLFTLEISTEEVQKKGMRVDGLTAAIKEQFRTAGGVEAANGPGPAGRRPGECRKPRAARLAHRPRFGGGAAAHPPCRPLRARSASLPCFRALRG